MKRRINLFEDPVFKIVADGMVSIAGFGEGRPMPAIIIDALENKAIPDLIQVHKVVKSGDTQSQWIKGLFDTRNIILTLDFSNPIKVSFGIEFNFLKHYPIIDGIIQSKGLVLIIGKYGDKVSSELNNGIIVEVPENGYETIWDNVLLKLLKQVYQKKGFSKKHSITVTNEHIKTMREIWHIRRN